MFSSSIESYLAPEESRSLNNHFVQLQTVIDQFQKKFNHAHDKDFINTITDLCNEIKNNMTYQLKNQYAYQTMLSSDAFIVELEIISMLQGLLDSSVNVNNYQCTIDNFHDTCDELFANNIPNLFLKIFLTGFIYMLASSVADSIDKNTVMDATKSMGVHIAGTAAAFYLFSKSTISQKVDAMIKEGDKWASMDHHHSLD